MIGSKSGNYSLNMSLRIEDLNDKNMEMLQKKQKNLKLTNKNKNFTDSYLQKGIIYILINFLNYLLHIVCW